MDFLRGLGRGSASAHGALTGKTLTIEGHRVRVGNVLASGGFGFVYHAKDETSLMLYALKHIMPGDSPEALEVARTEVRVAEQLAEHPHAVRLLAASPRPPQLRTDCFLLMELCQESCGAVLLSRPDGLPEQEALQLCRAVASVLAALHAEGISHWDVKPDNVLRCGGVWKLCDFGSATTRPAGAATPRERGRLEDNIQRRTTPAYRAPEMYELATHATVGPAADVWAMGCLLGATLGAPPFRAEDKLRILQGAYRPPARASPGVAALLQRLLAVSPEGRPCAVEALAALDTLLEGGMQPAVPPAPQLVPQLVPHVPLPLPLPPSAALDAAPPPLVAAVLDADEAWAHFD